jgi:four helix bundle protein
MRIVRGLLRGNVRDDIIRFCGRDCPFARSDNAPPTGKAGNDYDDWGECANPAAAQRAPAEGVNPMLVDRSYRRVPVGRAATQLAQAVYDLVACFPDDERSGLTATLKKTVASIPPKIADSYMKDDPAEAAKTLEATITSLRELAGYLDVAQHLRMTSRRRFRRPRRRAVVLYDRICDVLDAI